MPTYQVTIGERILQVTLRREGSIWYAQVDQGSDVVVDLATVRGPLRSLLLGDKRIELLATRGADGVDLTIAGIPYRAEVLDEAHARLAQVAGARGAAHGKRDLKAPMPGLVVKVLAAEGDEVAAHQPLVVLQAMKMENELALPRAGKVSKVQAQPGQTVEAGQVLVTLEE
jgi:biotin carboxyl carrier protein